MEEINFFTCKGDARKLLLFIGEGNFSFSASLSLSPEFSTLNCRLIATDLIPELGPRLEERESGEGDNGLTQRDDDVPKVRTNLNISKNLLVLRRNISALKSKGCTVLYDIDATKIHEHEVIQEFCKETNISEVYIIFNFPHVKSKKMKIGLNRDLLCDFFKSCDRLSHDLQEQAHVIPIVSLCAGQSGIPEVETVKRSWGDSWQINDMAAHGHFVCTSVCKFEDWILRKLTSSCKTDVDKLSAYQSSYYRLQTGVGFLTDSALTFSYQQRTHIDPLRDDRLMHILKFTKNSHNSGSKIITDFLVTFSPLGEEKLVISSTQEQFVASAKAGRPFIHTVACLHTDTSKILSYLQNSKGSGKLEQDLRESKDEDCCQIFIKQNVTGESSLVGKVYNQESTMILFADSLLELKYQKDYRFLLSDAIEDGYGESLYPCVHEFHISFWISVQYSVQSFVETLLDVYGLMLKAVEFVEEYVSNAGRKSVCWKIQVQSLDLPVSRAAAHEMYLHFRTVLSNRLKVEVR